MKFRYIFFAFIFFVCHNCFSERVLVADLFDYLTYKNSDADIPVPREKALFANEKNVFLLINKEYPGDYQLRIEGVGEFVLFVNGELYEQKFNDLIELDIRQLKYKNGSVYLYLFGDVASLKTCEIVIPQRIVEDSFNPVVLVSREVNIGKDTFVFLLYLVGLLSLFSYLVPDFFQLHFNLSSVFSLGGVNKDEIGLNVGYNYLITIFLLVILTFFVFFFNFPKELAIPTMGRNDFFFTTDHWTTLIIYLLLAVVAKIIWLRIMAWLSNQVYFFKIHELEFVRYFLVGAFIFSFFVFLDLKTTVFGLLFYEIIMVLWIGYWLIKIFFIVQKNTNFRSLSLILYICATELMPLMLMAGYLN